MIIKVKIDEQVYEVEISDLQKRPIIAVVGGEEFEVWPEGEPTVHTQRSTSESENKYYSLPTDEFTQPTLARHVHKTSEPNPNNVSSSRPGNGSLLVVRAPIPGVITAINIQAGAEVTVGQQLCVLEAMKMNNSIRSSRAGHIAAVHITVGQHVKHHDVLLEYAD